MFRFSTHVNPLPNISPRRLNILNRNITKVIPAAALNNGTGRLNGKEIRSNNFDIRIITDRTNIRKTQEFRKNTILVRRGLFIVIATTFVSPRIIRKTRKLTRLTNTVSTIDLFFFISILGRRGF